MAITFVGIGLLTYYVTPVAFVYSNFLLVLIILNIVLLLFLAGVALLLSFLITSF